MTSKKRCSIGILEIIQMYGSTEIGLRVNVSIRYINSVLQKNKVVRTLHGCWKRKYTVNEDYF
jgi:hypothetical protein